MSQCEDAGIDANRTVRQGSHSAARTDARPAPAVYNARQWAFASTRRPVKRLSVDSPVVTSLVVDVVSDVVCPWCYIGKRKLERALAELRGREPELEVAVRW